ncbi:MAG: hypothetical protein SXA11_17745 [Cyanobacteriota bacterium]|nr:hypothetical protein [Cyanobacteriota bacterium]
MIPCKAIGSAELRNLVSGRTVAIATKLRNPVFPTIPSPKSKIPFVGWV